MDTGFCAYCLNMIESKHIVTVAKPVDGPPCLVHVTCAYPKITADEMAAYPTAAEASASFQTCSDMLT